MHDHGVDNPDPVVGVRCMLTIILPSVTFAPRHAHR